MAKEKGRQWDGKSGPTNIVYKKRWEEIFGKKQQEELDKEDQEYLDSLKEKI